MPINLKAIDAKLASLVHTRHRQALLIALPVLISLVVAAFLGYQYQIQQVPLTDSENLTITTTTQIQIQTFRERLSEISTKFYSSLPTLPSLPNLPTFPFLLPTANGQVHHHGDIDDDTKDMMDELGADERHLLQAHGSDTDDVKSNDMGEESFRLDEENGDPDPGSVYRHPDWKGRLDQWEEDMDANKWSQERRWETDEHVQMLRERHERLMAESERATREAREHMQRESQQIRDEV